MTISLETSNVTPLLKLGLALPISYMVVRRRAQVKDQDSSRVLAIVAYVLFLIGWPTLHMATIGGVILAYVQRGEVRGTIWESHFEAIISTFWTSLIAGAVGILLCVTIVGLIAGVPMLIGLVIWFLYRSIRGLLHAIESKAY
jgi:uncharacterized membrane protein